MLGAMRLKKENIHLLPDGPRQFLEARVAEGIHSDSGLLTEFAGRLCYQSWDNASGRTTEQYLLNITDQRHFSVLEHTSIMFVLFGVSRAFTHELVRHRHFSFSQLSQRFVNEQDVGIVVPPAMRDQPEMQARLQAFQENARSAYADLVAELDAVLAKDLTLSKTMRRKRAREAARALLPNMTPTQIAVTGNMRAWLEFADKRNNEHADLEMQTVAKEIVRQIAEEFPEVFA